MVLPVLNPVSRLAIAIRPQLSPSMKGSIVIPANSIPSVTPDTGIPVSAQSEPNTIQEASAGTTPGEVVTDEVNSFAPAANVGFMPNYTGAPQNAQFVQNTSPSYVPPTSYESAQPSSGGKKSRRKKNPINIGTVIAATLASAIIASGATSMVFLYADALGRKHRR